MCDIPAVLETIRRPRLLMQAARIGMGAYRRGRDLRRLIGGEAPTDQAIARLIFEEHKQEISRIAGTAEYSPARHIELLAALIAEACRLPRLVN
jgi:Family of unknown function (DUF6477)